VVRVPPARSLLVKGIIAPFDSLGLFSHVYQDRPAPNVLSLLGNTLGNMSDDFGFLETLLASGMWPGDLLLLEVRCHVDEDAGAGPGMGDETKKRLNFGPLEMLGATYEEHRELVTIRREHSRSVIPNTVTTGPVANGSGPASTPGGTSAWPTSTSTPNPTSTPSSAISASASSASGTAASPPAAPIVSSSSTSCRRRRSL
jgi:hypothetical protein